MLAESLHLNMERVFKGMYIEIIVKPLRIGSGLRCLVIKLYYLYASQHAKGNQ